MLQEPPPEMMKNYKKKEVQAPLSGRTGRRMKQYRENFLAIRQVGGIELGMLFEKDRE